MKKLITLLIIAVLSLGSGTIFTICGRLSTEIAEISHEHVYSSTWQQNDTHHWKVCENTSCGKTVKKNEHSWGETACTVCQHPRPSADADLPDGFTFQYLEETDSYQVVGYNGTVPADVVIPAEYEGKPVTHVASFQRTAGQNGKYAYQTMTSVVFPDSVTHIEKYAFSICEALRSVTFGTGLQKIDSDAFQNCRIEQVHIASLESWCNVTFISETSHPAYGRAADLYINGEKITDLTIPASITSIGHTAFYGFASLCSVSISTTAESDLGHSAFACCENLTSVSISGGLQSLSATAFKGCTALTTVLLPDTMRYLGRYAFANCTALTQFAFPSNLKTLDDNAFNGSGITEAVLPDGLEILGDSVFANCTALTSVSLPDTLLEFRSYPFEGTPYYSNLLRESDGAIYAGHYLLGIKSGTNIQGTFTVADGTIGIANGALSSNVLRHNMTEVVLPDSIRFIGVDAFYQCTGLATINLPEGLLSIGKRAFAETALQSVALPRTLTFVGYQAFADCTALASIHAYSTLQMIAASSFENTAYEKDQSNWKDGLLYLGSSILLKADKNLEGVVTVDADTITIACYAFADCTKITEVRLAHTQRILAFAFSNCSALTTLYANPELSYIGESAFSRSGLNSIHFYGLQEQWEAIEIDPSVTTDNLTLRFYAH